MWVHGIWENKKIWRNIQISHYRITEFSQINLANISLQYDKLRRKSKASFNISIHSTCEQSAEYLGILFLIFRILKLKILERVQRGEMSTCFL